MVSIMSHTLRLIVLLLIAFLFSIPFALPAPVHAADFTVDTLTDEADGSCSDGDCSLRDALALADANGVPDTIEFSVAGTITVEAGLGDLSALTDSGTTIDGTTAPGYSGTPVVAISGDSGISDGLRIESFQNTVKGLHIHSFALSCVLIDSGSGNIVGPNVVMSNCSYGAVIMGAASYNSIEDSLIGTDVTGTSAWGNDIAGVILYSEPPDPGPTINYITGNVVSGNTYLGILLVGGNTYQNEIKGNYIGVTADGVTPLSNGGAGIWIEGGAFENYIGGDGPGEGNIIAYNASVAPGTGIVVVGDSGGNRISRNSIYDNIDLGIDLGDDGVTCTGPISVDGPNDLIPCPVITSATTTLVSGTACLECTVEVFIADPDPSGYGEGKTFVGDADTDESGNFAVSVTGVDDCDWLTATATSNAWGTYGSTSEFALNVQVPCPEPTPTPTPTATRPHKRPTKTPTPEPTDTPAPTETPLPPAPTLAPPPVPTATPFGGIEPALLPPSTGDGPAPEGLSLPDLALLLAAAGSALAVGGFCLRIATNRRGDDG